MQLLKRVGLISYVSMHLVFTIISFNYFVLEKEGSFKPLLPTSAYPQVIMIKSNKALYVSGPIITYTRKFHTVITVNRKVPSMSLGFQILTFKISYFIISYFSTTTIYLIKIELNSSESCMATVGLI